MNERPRMLESTVAPSLYVAPPRCPSTTFFERNYTNGSHLSSYNSQGPFFYRASCSEYARIPTDMKRSTDFCTPVREVKKRRRKRKHKSKSKTTDTTLDTQSTSSPTESLHSEMNANTSMDSPSDFRCHPPPTRPSQRHSKIWIQDIVM